MNKLYPHITPYKIHFLSINIIHTLYIEESGNPKGIPVLRIHGGPGSASDEKQRQFYNPKKYRIILFDQRGCGKSKPLGELKDNTTHDLIEDCERIRKYLKIKSWIVTGGSWGSSLALLYAQKYQKSVQKLLIWSVYLFSKEETVWQFKNGANKIFPDFWEEFEQFIPANERRDMLKAYKRRIFSKNTSIAKKAIKYFTIWELYIMSLIPDEEEIKKIKIDKHTVSSVKIFMHYLNSDGFINPNQILLNCNKIAHIPTTILHSRYDITCPLDNAWKLHKTLPKSRLIIVPKSGHRSSDPELTKAIIKELDSLT